MASRELLRQQAAELLAVMEAGRYHVDDLEVDFAAQQNHAVEHTVLYTPAALTALRSEAAPEHESPVVRVVDATSQVEAGNLASVDDDRHIALLNFASARNPGGGFVNGAKAQEEDLCRCSGLYPCLLRAPGYYEANRRQRSLLYSDHVIFSPKVPFFKITSVGPFLPTPFLVSVITAPAPNSGPFLRANPEGQNELAETFERRWRNVLRIALDQGVTHLLLGAWGCGAFGGDPLVSSRAARDALRSDGFGLEEVIFAIPGDGRQSAANLRAFQSTLLGSE